MAADDRGQLVDSLAGTAPGSNGVGDTIAPPEPLEATLRSGGGLGDDEAAKLSPDARTAVPTLPVLELVPGDAPGAPSAELTVMGVLGEGGMGRVLVARQRSLAREVAVKVLKAVSPPAAAALLAEARITGHLEHPSVVPIHALGRDTDGNPVLVMKRIDGVVWTELLADPRHPAWQKMGWVRAAGGSENRRTAHLELLLAVCNAVHFAHSRGIVHRDLKPDNVMIGEFGEVYVTDWGIALPFRTPAAGPQRPLAGTPAFMAPEMARCDPEVDERTDVYLLGAVLHQILTGSYRNEGRTIAEVLGAALTPKAFTYGAEVPEELAGIANKATAARREDRFQTVQELQRALADHLRHLGSIALAEAAELKLAELRDRLAARGTGPASAAIEMEIDRLFAECRLSFQLALSSWAENPAALRGLEACLELLVNARIARGDALGARGILLEMRAPAPELLAKVEAVERSIAAKEKELQNLEAMARDLDPSVGAGPRLAMLVGGLIVNTIAVAILVKPGLLGLSERHRILLIPVAFTAVGLLIAAVGGRRLQTAFNKRMAGLLLFAFAMVFVHRLLAFQAGDPTNTVLRADLLIISTVLISAAITHHRLLALGAIPFFLAAIVLPTELSSQTVIFGVAAIVGMLTLVVLSVVGGRGAK